ncbi:unnamed protein product [Clavelina lepadiformis]|uniref:Major facilitator superfamily (MFS) profile domain-containing protein n=1 Tax=Clavelina lepadiformis TaxID=159417 RepID=A0ABP0FP51_CLALP
MVKTSSCCMDFLKKARQSKVIAVVIVSTTLLIDYMLLLAIVPVVPPFLWKIHLKEHPEISQNHVDQVHDISTSTSYTPAFSNSTFMVEATVQPPMKELESAYLATQSVKIAAVIAAKPAVQIIANIFVGPLIDRIGYHIPLFVGLVVICFTAITFGLGQTYAVLLISVAIQGIGSSCAMAGGMTMLASVYIDPQKRGQVIGICLSAIGVGLVAGPPYGSVMNAFVGKPATFLLLAGITILTGICQVCYSSLKIEKIHANNEAPSMWILLKDPYILLAASSISLVNIVFGVLNSGLPAWLIKTFKSPKWLIGLAYLPLCIAYAVTTNVMSFIPAKTYRWAFALGGVVSSSLGCLCLPFATRSEKKSQKGKKLPFCKIN